MLKKFMLGMLLLAIVVVALALYRSLTTPDDLWWVSGRFASCPSRPSCVSSVAGDAEHQIAPLRYTGTAQAARARLEAVIQGMPDSTIEHARPDYLHALFVTPTMRFRDDLELLVQVDGVIHVRSISRFAYRDLGVNRARVETLRAAFAKAEGAVLP